MVCGRACKPCGHQPCPTPATLASQVNGKKLHPARGTFASFLLPLLAWWLVALIIYGVSFQKVAMLQAPLTSMQVRGLRQPDNSMTFALSPSCSCPFAVWTDCCVAGSSPTPACAWNGTTNTLHFLLCTQAAAHVQFNIARTRMLANQIGFLFDGYASPERTDLLTSLNTELKDLRSEYFSMLYGGPLKIAVSAPHEHVREHSPG